MKKRKLKIPKDWEFERYDAILNIDSLDREVEIDGELMPFGHTLHDRSGGSGKYKAWILSFATNETQREIIELLCQGFKKKDIAQQVKVSYSYVRNLICQLRKKCKKLRNENEKLKRR